MVLYAARRGKGQASLPDDKMFLRYLQAEDA